MLSVVCDFLPSRLVDFPIPLFSRNFAISSIFDVYLLQGPDDGIPIVFVHGLAISSFSWDGQVRRFLASGKKLRILTYGILLVHIYLFLCLYLFICYDSTALKGIGSRHSRPSSSSSFSFLIAFPFRHLNDESVDRYIFGNTDIPQKGAVDLDAMIEQLDELTQFCFGPNTKFLLVGISQGGAIGTRTTFFFVLSLYFH